MASPAAGWELELTRTAELSYRMAEISNTHITPASKDSIQVQGKSAFEEPWKYVSLGLPRVPRVILGRNLKQRGETLVTQGKLGKPRRMLRKPRQT